MKYLYLTLLLILSCSVFAQTVPSKKPTSKKNEKPVIGQITKPAPSKEEVRPIVPDSLSKKLLNEFQQAVIFVVDRKNDRSLREDKATTFARRFKTGAKIAVLIGKDTLFLDPVRYFYRLMNYDQKYDAVTISFEPRKGNQFKRMDNDNNKWKTQYTIDQYFEATIEKKVVYSDHTIKTVDMSFFYESEYITWESYLGNILVLYSENTTPKKTEQPQPLKKVDEKPKKKKVSNHK